MRYMPLAGRLQQDAAGFAGATLIARRQRARQVGRAGADRATGPKADKSGDCSSRRYCEFVTKSRINADDFVVPIDAVQVRGRGVGKNNPAVVPTRGVASATLEVVGSANGYVGNALDGLTLGQVQAHDQFVGRTRHSLVVQRATKTGDAQDNDNCSDCHRYE